MPVDKVMRAADELSAVLSPEQKSMKLVYSLVVGVGAFFAFACGSGDDGSGGSSEGTPSSFEHKFETAGSFPHFCDPHCSIGMKAKVIVD